MSDGVLTPQQSLLENHLRKTAIVSNVISIMVALIVAMSVGYGFFYKTNSTLEEHTEDIKYIQNSVETVNHKLNEIELFKGVSTVELKALEEKVDANNRQVEKMLEKLDKILLQTR